MYRIVTRSELNPATFLWEIEAPAVARAAQPGQFVMVRLHDGSERIPLTVADFDRRQGSITVVVQALGKTTREMRDDYEAGGNRFGACFGQIAAVTSHKVSIGIEWRNIL